MRLSRVLAACGATAIDHTCPPGRPSVQEYILEGRNDTYTAECKGSAERNGFYGAGIVNAWGVVR